MGAFTDAKLRAKPESRTKWLTEGGARGGGKLLFRISPNGAKRFYYRMPAGSGNRAPVPLEPYDPEGKRGYTLAQAREKVAELEGVRREHGNPIAFRERQEAERRRAEQEHKGTFGEVLTAYVEKLKREHKESARAVENALRRHVREAHPSLLKRKAADVTPADMHGILSRIAAAGHTRQVNKMRSYLTAAFNYGTKSAYDPRRAQGAASFHLESNPAALTMRVAEFERAGDRVLSADELAAYWKHLDQVSNVVVRGFLRVHLLLAGQRIAQLARLRECDIDFDSRIIRLKDSKGRDGVARDHLLPLTERVHEILEQTPQVVNAQGWRFTTSGRAALNPATVSNAVGDYAHWLTDNAGVEPFCARDLRRTCETRLAALRISEELRGHLLSHGRSGVQHRHYDRWKYLQEKREALMLWERYLDGLTDPRKVLDFASRKPAGQDVV